MTTDIITTQQALEARADGTPVASDNFIVHGINLMPHDDGSLARRVYNSAVDKNNPPVELVTQYLFQNGYRRIEEVSTGVKLNAMGRYEEFAHLMFLPDQRYFTELRKSAFYTLVNGLRLSAASGLPDLVKPAESYCRRHNLDLSILTCEPADLSGFENMIRAQLVADGLRTEGFIAKPIQSLDVFVRGYGGNATDIFAFIERAQPKGLKMSFRRAWNDNVPVHINSLFTKGHLDGKHFSPKCAHKESLIKQAQWKYENAPLAYGVLGTVAALVGLGFGAPVVVGAGMIGALTSLLYVVTPGDRKCREVLSALNWSLPFPGLSIQAKMNYQAIQTLEIADSADSKSLVSLIGLPPTTDRTGSKSLIHK